MPKNLENYKKIVYNQIVFNRLVNESDDSMQSKFKITEQQKELLKPFIPDIEDYLHKNLSELLHEMNLVISGELDDHYEDTPNSILLQKVYDELIEQN